MNKNATMSTLQISGLNRRLLAYYIRIDNRCGLDIGSNNFYAAFTDVSKNKIITDESGNKIVLINDIRFKGKRNINWNEVKSYLRGYIGQCYEIEETAEKIYLGSRLPDEFTGSKSTKALLGANAKAKANSSLALPELIQIAKNPIFEENKEIKHNKDAKYGWYRYSVRFGLPIYEERKIVRYNIFNARLLVNHASNNKKYLYDILAIKKETSKPQQYVR